jgi:murein DD-endopeptidase MepM/ murein hydrolase activator NlpD
VVIAHPGGMESTYSHLLRVARGLEDDQAVRRGQVIGYVGATGLPPGAAPHLHFGVRVSGRYVDPLRLTRVREPAVPVAARDRFAAAMAPLAQRLAALEVKPPAPARGNARRAP